MVGRIWVVRQCSSERLHIGRRPYAVAPMEFQSGDDADMGDRVGEYARWQLDTLRRQGVIPAGDAPPALLEEVARFAGPPHRPFREALHAWAGELWTRWPGGGALPPLDELEGLEPSEMTSIVDANIAE